MPDGVAPYTTTSAVTVPDVTDAPELVPCVHDGEVDPLDEPLDELPLDELLPDELLPDEELLLDELLLAAPLEVPLDAPLDEPPDAPPDPPPPQADREARTIAATKIPLGDGQLKRSPRIADPHFPLLKRKRILTGHDLGGH